MLTLCGLALGLAVVLWGAGYKMAQYPQQGRAFRVMSPAKLLTDRERPVRAGGLRIVLSSAASQRARLWLQPMWIARVCPGALQAELLGALVPAPRQRNVVLPELNYFFFRPPPSCFFS